MSSGESRTRWQRVEEIFLGALEWPAAARGVFLDEACAGDAALRAEVSTLLDAHGRDGALPQLEDRTTDAPPLDRIGPYQLLRRIGEGGMGAVYLAEREGSDFRQTVALKLIRAGFADASLDERLRGERRILARLEHPGIARLIDGGVAPWGQPFLAMEYVAGQTLLAYCDAQRLTLRERIRLFLRVCDAVHYAHQHLVVHRDLKPGNLLVTPDGQPKLLDFGIAKLLDADEDAGGTRTAPWITPAYASPEQVRGEAVGTACDVYALGLLLYETLVGGRAYEVEGHSPAEIERLICERVPAAPSQGVRSGVSAALLTARRTTVERLRRDLAGDLDTIVLRALAKEPARRYGSAEQLAEDLRRYLDGKPVLARGDTFVYRAGKFVQRHRAAVAAGALAIVALLTGSSLAVWQAGHATRQAAIAEEEAAKAQLVASVMVDLFRLNDPTEALGDTVTARHMLDRGTERIEQEFGDQPRVQAALLLEVARVYRNLGILSRAEALAQRALALSETNSGARSAEVSLALAQLGEVQAALGKRDSAIVTLRRALEVRERLQDQSADSIAANLLASLAWVLRDTGEHDEAAVLFERALDAQRVVYGDDAPRLAPVMLGLASAYHDRGRFDDAETLFQRALARTDTTRPHPMAATALLNVGMLRRVREQYTAAEPLLRAALEQHERLFGPEHPAVLEAMIEWSRALLDLGRFREGQAVARDGLARAMLKLGATHPSTNSLRQTLAVSHYHLGEYDRANAHFDTVLNAKRAQYGGDHPDLVFALLQSSEPLLEQGKLVAAAARVREANAMGERLGSSGGVYHALALRFQARVAAQRRDFATAREHVNEALDIAAARLRPDHRYTREFQRTRALVLLDTGTPAEAARVLESVLDDDRRVLPQSHPQIGITLTALAEAYLGTSRPADAEAALREAMLHLTELGATHWRVGEVRSLLGAALLAQGRNEGRALLEDGARVVRNHLGSDSSAAKRAQRRTDQASP